MFAAGNSSPGRAQSRPWFLFYFNGFNSAIPEDWSDNQKIVALEAWAHTHGLRFIPCSVNYRRAGLQAREILASLRRETGGVIFSGSLSKATMQMHLIT